MEFTNTSSKYYDKLVVKITSTFLTLDKFDCQGDPTSVGVRWERWKRALLIYLEASNIDKDVKKRASLLHFGGLELQEIFYNIPGANITPSNEIDVFTVAITKLDEYFAPKQSKVYERHIFRLLKQEPDEKFEKFLVRLRNQADKCKFTDKDEHIIDQIAEKGNSTELRKKILKIGDSITLDQIIIEANTLEVVNNQLNQFDTTNKDETVNKIESKFKMKSKEPRGFELECGRCSSRRHKSNDLTCPARDKECLKCGLRGHFRQFCRTRQNFKRKFEWRNSNVGKGKKAKNETVNQIVDLEEPNKEEDTYYVFHIDDDVEFDCTIGGVKTKVLVDSGCKKNLITAETWESMKTEKAKVFNQVENPNINFMAYGSNTPLKVKGSFQARLQVGDKSEDTTFYVITNGTRNLLGKMSAMAMGILKIGLDLQLNYINLRKFPKFKNIMIDLPIDDSVPPVSQPYRNEDIRDAILSLVQTFRVSEDKLERHEYREKALGETLKKMIIGLEKKYRVLEPLKSMISRLDERIYNVENIFLQKEEKEKATLKKTHETLIDIQTSLQALTAIVTKNQKPETSLDTNLTTEDEVLSKRLDATDAKIDAVKKEIEGLKNSFNKDALRAMCLEMSSNVNPLERHISEAEKLLNKYELKLNEYNGNTSKVQTDFVPLSEVSLADEAWHNKMTEVMERQEQDIKKIQQLLSAAESMWKDLPRLADLQRATNHTLESLADVQQNLNNATDKSALRVTTKLREMNDRLLATNEDVQQSLTQSNTMTERAYGDISRSYDTLRTQVEEVSKNGHVMLQAADTVISTKKLVEYGVHQILVEVGQLVVNQGKNLNKSMSARFDAIENTILANQTFALGNLSSKIESDMVKVWRQIGNMYQQLTTSKSSLDKLNDRMTVYVNDSTATMDNMKDKVGSITARMVEVHDNLNYLLGRLSLVTQEFSQIKTGIGEALEKAKSGLREVTKKIEDKGPGPHKTED